MSVIRAPTNPDSVNTSVAATVMRSRVAAALSRRVGLEGLTVGMTAVRLLAVVTRVDH